MNKNEFIVLSGNTIVAKWEDKTLTVFNENLLPLYLKYNPNAEHWIASRAIDSRRANARLLKKVLRLKGKDDLSTATFVNAATITDNYWIKPLDSDLTYQDVRFTDDYFSVLALKGSYSSFNRVANSKRTKTPELQIIAETLLQTVLKTVNMKVRRKEIVELIMKRYAMILK